MGFPFTRRKEKLNTVGVETPGPHQGLPLSQPSEDCKTPELDHKTLRKPLPIAKTDPAVQGSSGPYNAVVMPGRRESPKKSDAPRKHHDRHDDRGRHDRRGRHGGHSTESSSPQISNASLAQSHQGYRSGLWAWIDHLPQSVDDDNIISNVQQVFTFADQYVNNFYVDRPSQQRDCEPFLCPESFGNLPDGIQPADVIHIVAQPTAVIKHSLVATLLSTISLTRPGPYSLLPPEFTALAKAVSSGGGFATDINRG